MSYWCDYNSATKILSTNKPADETMTNDHNTILKLFSGKKKKRILHIEKDYNKETTIYFTND